MARHLVPRISRLSELGPTCYEQDQPRFQKKQPYEPRASLRSTRQRETFNGCLEASSVRGANSDGIAGKKEFELKQATYSFMVIGVEDSQQNRRAAFLLRRSNFESVLTLLRCCFRWFGPGSFLSQKMGVVSL